MKNKLKIYYLLAFLIPIGIFFIASSLNNFFPIGENIFNIYDARHQYPGFFLQLKDIDLFNFSGGLGFNFFGLMVYYLLSPFNILIIFFNNFNIYAFFAILIYIKIALAGLFMFIFLKKEKQNNLNFALIFSVAYSLCGFISCYYYNVMWLDAIYMLPLVLLGINKLVLENKKFLYFFTLLITIIINFYIGYMVCIFSIIYFIYKILTENNINYKRSIKCFLITSLLVGLISAIVIIPAYFALIQGKSLGFTELNAEYIAINPNIVSFFYNLTPGAFYIGGQQYGPPLIYSSILVIILVILFFFNKAFSKKEKIVVGSILLFFFISFNFNLIDFAWQFFQQPIWWQSRYSFVFSAFLIIIGYKSILNIDKLDLSLVKKIIISIILSALVIISFILTYDNIVIYKVMAIIFLAISVVFIINYIFFIQNKKFMWFIIILFFLEIFINNFNDLKKNTTNTTANFYTSYTQSINTTINKLEEYDDSFYKLELVSDYTSNDGMFFDYNGINYFNSVRNNKIILFTKKYFNFDVESNASIKMNNFNPYILSLFNMKYLVDAIVPYYEKVVDNYSFSAYENPYPLSTGIVFDNYIKDVKLKENDIDYNINKIFGVDSYVEKSGEFVAEKDYILVRDDFALNNYVTSGSFTALNPSFNLIKKGDKVKFVDTVKLLDLETYENRMQELSNNLLELTESNGNLSGTLNVDKDDQVLLLTIPYDEGITIKVNGKKVKPDILFDTFFALDLDAGEYDIEITYFPKGLFEGLIISSIGIVLSSIYFIYTKKKH